MMCRALVVQVQGVAATTRALETWEEGGLPHCSPLFYCDLVIVVSEPRFAALGL